jgi:hypothetical protein
VTLSADQAIVPQPTCGTVSVPTLVKSDGTNFVVEQYEDDVVVDGGTGGANASTTTSIELATIMAMVAARLLLLNEPIINSSDDYTCNTPSINMMIRLLGTLFNCITNDSMI